MQDFYIQRLVDPRLDSMLRNLPGVLIRGPRGCGKTTTALRRASAIYRFNDSGQLSAVRSDPYGVLSHATPPVLVDEWQLFPEALSTIKQLIDETIVPGRFLLTGSVSAPVGPTSWAATGRLTPLTMWSMCQREILDKVDNTSIIDDWADSNFEPQTNTSEYGIRDYVRCALDGGFPESLRLKGTREQGDWLDGYVSELLSRNEEISADPRQLNLYARAVATTSAQVASDQTIAEAAGRISHTTASKYQSILEGLFVITALPAWWSNKIKRLTKSPKRFVCDTSLLRPLAQVTETTVLSDGRLLGPLVETFVVQQLRSELVAAHNRAQMFHLRTEGGRQEVDVVLELEDARLIGIEVKANSAPDARDASHLEWFRDANPDKFVTGIVLHTGKQTYKISDRIFATPISSLWE